MVYKLAGLLFFLNVKSRSSTDILSLLSSLGCGCFTLGSPDLLAQLAGEVIAGVLVWFITERNDATKNYNNYFQQAFTLPVVLPELSVRSFCFSRNFLPRWRLEFLVNIGNFSNYISFLFICLFFLRNGWRGKYLELVVLLQQFDYTHCFFRGRGR